MNHHSIVIHVVANLGNAMLYGYHCSTKWHTTIHRVAIDLLCKADPKK